MCPEFIRRNVSTIDPIQNVLLGIGANVEHISEYISIHHERRNVILHPHLKRSSDTNNLAIHTQLRLHDGNMRLNDVMVKCQNAFRPNMSFHDLYNRMYAE